MGSLWGPVLVGPVGSGRSGPVDSYITLSETLVLAQYGGHFVRGCLLHAIEGRDIAKQTNGLHLDWQFVTYNDFQ